MTGREAVALLRDAGVPEPEADVRWLRRLAPTDQFATLVEERRRRRPLQHLLGTVAFRYVELICDRRALVPRLETEVTAGVAIDAMPAGGSCLDLCTGAGPIAVSIAKEVPGSRVVATDISPAALDLADENARRSGLAIDLRLGDLYGPVRGETFDVIVANPPYVAEHEWEELEPEVRDHDPRLALVAGPTGLEVLEQVVEGAAEHLASRGMLVVEIAPGQAGWAEQHGDVLPDLAGRPRVLRTSPQTDP